MRSTVTIVECGSSLSTILFGSLVQAGKLDRVLSLEHDEQWFDYCRFRLEEKGLSGCVDLQLCSLRQKAVSGYLVKW